MKQIQQERCNDVAPLRQTTSENRESNVSGEAAKRQENAEVAPSLPTKHSFNDILGIWKGKFPGRGRTTSLRSDAPSGVPRGLFLPTNQLGRMLMTSTG